MARQWRLETKGGVYHVLSRGNNRQDIFKDDNDRRLFMQILGLASLRFSIETYGFVLMSNHYHLLLTTNDANLSQFLS